LRLDAVMLRREGVVEDDCQHLASALGPDDHRLQIVEAGGAAAVWGKDSAVHDLTLLWSVMEGPGDGCRRHPGRLHGYWCRLFASTALMVEA
jgi:hypothetical protein